MSTNLSVALNWNNTGGLAVVLPQPKFPPISYVKYNASLSRVVNVQGPYLPLSWRPGFDEPEWTPIIALFGISFKNGVYNHKVTVAIPHFEDGSVNNYNGMAEWHGEPQKNFGIWKNADIVITGLVQI